MATQTFTVSLSNPVPLFPAGSLSTLTVDNSDINNTVWLSDTAGGSDGFPLSPGSMITWDSGRPLYAYVVTGKPVTLLVLLNGGSLFNAGALAQQIIAQGLADSIAAAITLSGVPTIDAYTVVASGAASLNAAPVSLFNVNVSRYASLYVSFTESTTGDYQTPRQYVFKWRDTTGAITAIRSIWLTQGPVQHFNFPTEGSLLEIVVSPNAFTGVGLNYSVIGSYRNISKSFYRNDYYPARWSGVGDSTDNFAAYNVVGTIGPGPQVVYPPSHGGEAVLSVSCDSCTTSPCVVSVMDLVTGYRIATIMIPVTATLVGYTLPFRTPNRPIRIYWVGGPVLNLNVNITYND